MLHASRPILILFDCDGTLVDSQFSIIAAMNSAFKAEMMSPPDAEAIRRVVGLPLVEAIQRLLSDDQLEAPPPNLASKLAEHYKEAFSAQREDESLHEPLFPGIEGVIKTLHEAGAILGVATGKSHRGLVATLERHHMLPLFSTLQTADIGPGKPNPAMLYRALEETGVEAADCVMIGDTVFDIEMARSGNVRSIGVSWGYHPSEDLLEYGANVLVRRAEELLPAIRDLLSDALHEKA
ncbi:MAG: HAD-IA family hydrolase [Alphaproteobacteria bacterium]|nr:HAD-IA family hydrolase [Alphaproteobacteria bacterium SS10]